MKKIHPIIILAVLLAAFTATSPESETITTTSIPDSCWMGDVDLDGISSSIADVAMFQSYFVCWWWGGPFPPEESIMQTDINCDGLTLSVADWVALIRILSGDLEPCYCQADCTRVLNNPPALRSTAEPYQISIVDQPGSGYQMDTVDIMISGTEKLIGYQLTLEYDTAHVMLSDVQPGALFEDWAVFSYTENVSVGTTARLKLIASVGPYPPDDSSITPPSEPGVLARLIFGINANSEVNTELRFVWEGCAENGIAVYDTTSGQCNAPDFLAVSRYVFDAEGNDITGMPGIYGGAGDNCLAGLEGGWTPPQRLIDFQSVLMTYTPTPSCCEGARGDVNGDGSDGDVADLTCLVEYIFGLGCTIPCYEEADSNADGFVDVSDLTLLVAYMFYGGPSPLPCN